VEELHAAVLDWSAMAAIPLELTLSAGTRDRLADPLLYDVIGIAGSIEQKQAERLPGGLSLKEALGQVYPMLGNAIQVAYEYVNGFIDRRELGEFYGMMAREGSDAMKDAGPAPAEPFFTPSSFHRRNGEDRTHHVIRSRKTIEKHRRLFRRFEQRCKIDE
jgi:hypothetical protein